MSDLCPQCGGPAYAPSNQCDVIWHTGAKPFGTSVVQDIEAQLAEQIEWVRRLADDLIAAEGREARLKEKLAKVEEAGVDVAASLNAAISLLERGGKKAAPSDKMFAQILVDYSASLDRFRATLAELTGGKDE